MTVVLGKNSYMSEPHYEWFNPQVETGAFCSIADKVTFCGAINHAWVMNKKIVHTFPFSKCFPHCYTPEAGSRGKIVVGNDVWIGIEAFILDGVTIGDGAIIGARAVVAKAVPPYAVVVGNPARVVHYRFTPEQIEKLLKINWWFWSEAEIRDRVHDLQDIDIFLNKYGL